jgi:RNA polymerase sigma factor (sigma-70 family)
MDASDRKRLNSLLAALADGDRTAFDPVFDLCAPLVRRYDERALSGSPEHEDVAQVALLKVFERASEYDRDRPALSWILGITANEVRTHRKRVMRRREGNEVEIAASAPTPEDRAIERDLIGAAEDLLESMSAIDREVVLESIRSSEPRDATFRKRLQRALARLRHAWKEVHDG